MTMQTEHAAPGRWHTRILAILFVLLALAALLPNRMPNAPDVSPRIEAKP
jgi:hypothetical protein